MDNETRKPGPKDADKFVAKETGGELSNPEEEKTPDLEHFDIAAVLGGGWREHIKGEKPKLSVDSRLRTIAAGIIASKGKIGELILSGGKTAGKDFPSEAETMQEYLLEKFPELSNFPIILDEESFDTIENAKFTSELMKEKGLESALLITNNYHILRANRNFKRSEVEASPLPAEEIIKESDRKYHLYKNFVRKYLSSCDVKKKTAIEVVLRGITAIDSDGKLLTALAKKLRHGDEIEQ